MSNNDTFYLVGVGASAGGFEALTVFLSALPENTGAAYVIIQHLSPNHVSQSHMVLANFTKMPVIKVTEQMQVEPNHVYVIPENKKLRIKPEGLLLEERGPARSPNLTVDVFFESLAETFEEKAVGIILSGTGSDGSRGVRTIKARGGMVMVQDPKTASFDSMPNVSISSDHPDYISAPDVLAQELVQYLKNPTILNKSLKSEPDIEHQSSLKKIIEIISSYSGVNFNNYKPGTIIRRIEKRMKINHLNKLPDYQEFLLKHPQEVSHIFDDFLIGVTRFSEIMKPGKVYNKKQFPNSARTGQVLNLSEYG